MTIFFFKINEICIEWFLRRCVEILMVVAGCVVRSSRDLSVFRKFPRSHMHSGFCVNSVHVCGPHTHIIKDSISY